VSSTTLEPAAAEFNMPVKGLKWPIDCSDIAEMKKTRKIIEICRRATTPNRKGDII
jgi:hypothetical protein